MGTADPADDELLDGATFEVWWDRVDDGFLEPGEDVKVFGPAEAVGGFLDTSELQAGQYIIVETVVPDGYTGSNWIVVELNVVPGTACTWDSTGLLDCVQSEGEGPGVTIVVVDNTPVEPTPTGGVFGATATPKVTLPPTDTIGDTPSSPSGEGWRLVLLAMAGLLAAGLILTPADAAVRIRRR